MPRLCASTKTENECERVCLWRTEREVRAFRVIARDPTPGGLAPRQHLLTEHRHGQKKSRHRICWSHFDKISSKFISIRLDFFEIPANVQKPPGFDPSGFR